ncbi:uncharacterized protein LOC141617197 [Silene latifolia]|uniref:uncharacterized protein LOC141617054 n=1 Tax=Silene latifolia TaxID=37657 RepID=UPI003D76AD61
MISDASATPYSTPNNPYFFTHSFVFCCLNCFDYWFYSYIFPQALLETGKDVKRLHLLLMAKEPHRYKPGTVALTKFENFKNPSNLLSPCAVCPSYVEGNIKKAIVSLTKDNKELQTKLNETNFILSKILEGTSSRIPSPELAHLAKLTLNSQVKTELHSISVCSLHVMAIFWSYTEAMSMIPTSKFRYQTQQMVAVQLDERSKPRIHFCE